MAVSNIDIDKDIVLPLLQPVISSVSLLEISNRVSDLVSNEVRAFISCSGETDSLFPPWLQSSEPPIDKLSLDHTPKSDHKTASEVELERLENKLRTIQLALQILTGVCATLPDPEPEVTVEDVSGDENESKASYII